MTTDLEASLRRLQTGTHNELDIQDIVNAIQSKVIHVEGDRGIGIGGNVMHSLINAGTLIQFGSESFEVGDEMLKVFRQALLPSQSPNLKQFQSLIQDKTSGFIGREYIFDEIRRFLVENPKGYLTIIGDPGMGKSAILAKYVEDTGCIAHFNVQLQGLNRSDQFLESICRQLVDRYDLPYDSLPPNVARDGEFLSQLLDEIVAQRNGEVIVIAVDALDEVDSGSYRDGNILYLPPHIPDGVYFILTNRRDVTVPLTIYAPQRVINLSDYGSDSQRDVRSYIDYRVSESESLRQRIDDRGESIPVFAERVTESSQNNFMYLRYVLQDIESGCYQDLSLEQFPKGLQAYYEFHWRRMGMDVKPLPVEKIKIVYILGEVRQPVSRQMLCDFSGEEQLPVQTVLNEWKQFLHTLTKDEQKRYGIYHASFRDFLHRQDILETHPVTIPGIHLLIAKDQLGKWKNRRR